MTILHDPQTKESIERRVAALQPGAERRWGRMTCDQMLWHLNCGIENSLGRFDVKDRKLPLPNAVLKFLVLNFPWRKGNTPTAPEFVARDRYDFAAEQARLLQLIDEVTAKPIDAAWPKSSFMGPMTGRDWSRLGAKHLDHHLSQFGV